MEILIRKPSWKRARSASRIIKMHNKTNPNMLARTGKDIKNSYFWIAENFGDKIMGFVGLFNWNGDGVEIVSHLVNRKLQRKEIGKKLLFHALREAKEMNSRIFLFTTETEYYKKFGFEIVGARNFPEKIRLRCQNCPKGPDGPGFLPCPESAMIFKDNNDISKIMPDQKNTGTPYMFY
jgi:N-acetylglutamate synthase-like GNAT family acetyltransferase